jgi:virulence-associated protein VapD
MVASKVKCTKRGQPTVSQLVMALKSFNLPYNGRKPELCKRLNTYLAEPGKTVELISQEKASAVTKQLPSKKELYALGVIGLKKLAKSHKLSTIGDKADLADRILKFLSTGQKTAKVSTRRRKAYKDLQEMMNDFKIENMQSLIALSDDQLNTIIDMIMIHEGKVSLRGLLDEVDDEDEKVRIIVDEMAKKLCRCIDRVKGQNLEESIKIAICLKNIFEKKGLSISRFQCYPTPMLIPKKGSVNVLLASNAN